MSARWLRAALLVGALPILLGAERPPGLGDVSEVRTWSHPGYTRVVVQLTRAFGEDIEVRRLPADAKSKRPERLYLDIEGIWVGREYKQGIPVGDGLLQAVRLGQNTRTRTRLVIDLQNYRSHRLLTLRSPHRVVVDVYGHRSNKPLRLPGMQEGDAALRPSMPLRPVETVVIDAGHGGKDPGAIGVGGLREKEVNLRLARMLRDELRLRGFKTVMTRSDDRFLDLEERTAVAESADGDLFVSIHANASPRRKTRGIEIYYLDENHERHSLDVAARENAIPRSEVDSLQRTLAKLRVSEASGHSQTLANLVHQDVVTGLASDRAYRRVPDLGIKKGPFYVLFLSSMPSILVETGFLTNREDAKLLRSEGYLSTLADRMARGLERYRDTGPQLVAEAGG